MEKRPCMIINFVLLAWFFLDMIGIHFGESYLVTRSWKEDGIYFLIYLVLLLLFNYKERIGKILLAVWLGIWLVSQFFSHEWFTIMGGGEGKSRYFEGSMKWINSDTHYIPDVYHTILHILILIAFVTLLSYSIKPKNKNDLIKL